MFNQGKLANVTRAQLAPLWGNMEISTEAIAKSLGVTRAGLSKHARSVLKLPSRRGNQGTRWAKMDQEFCSLWMHGVSLKDIRDELAFKEIEEVIALRRKMRLPSRKRTTGARGGWGVKTPLAEWRLIRGAEIERGVIWKRCGQKITATCSSERGK